MNRRKFLGKGVLAASAIPAFSLFTGCSSSRGNSSSIDPVSNIDALASSLRSEKESSDTLHSDSSNNIASTSTNSNAAARVLMGPSFASSQTSPFFSDKLPATTLPALYLTGDETSTMWDKYAAYNDVAYQQFSHQYTKLTASLRLFDYKNTQQSTSQYAPMASASFARQLSPAMAEGFSYFDAALEYLRNHFNASALDAVTELLNWFKGKMEELEGSESILYAIATYLSVDKLLEVIRNRAMSDLSFANSSEVMMSFAKMSVAAISLIGLNTLDKLSAAAAETDPSAGSAFADMSVDEITAYLNSISLQSKLSLLMMQIMEQYVTKTTVDVQAAVAELMSQAGDSELTAEEAAARDEMIDKLKTQSTVMGIVAMVMKALFAMLSNQATGDGTAVATDGFSVDSDAADFWMLFGSDSLPQDEAFMSYMSDLQTALENGGDFAAVFELISAMRTNFSTQAATFASDTESDAYTFADMMANLSFNFSAQTETDAYNFATHMADLAYGFTMKIEDDAYNFAFQGMEWGYLFASRGEEVGLMADRILWMAVQIGQMADRIGEMADRIVYTEQLIVYTEMLILDFGLLIYGGMKMITNLMLTGMALVLDREWYTPTAEDQILTLIGGTMSQMMENMQAYALAVLANQNVLRETTLSAMEWVDTSEPVVETTVATKLF
jgi:hypothetical protein